jgi:hypothetical protein
MWPVESAKPPAGAGLAMGTLPTEVSASKGHCQEG